LQSLTAGKKNFNFQGFVSNEVLHKLYLEQDIFILPSHAEGLPVSLIEAMKTGLVPVVSDINGGVREVIQHGKNGFLSASSDAKQFAESIATLYKDPLLCQQMAIEAIRSSESMFDPAVNSDHYWEIFSQAILTNRPKTFDPVPLSFLDRSWLPNGLVRWFRNKKNLFLPKS
jgi:glycosyltransferase involved in cell wall biosynthesis